MSPIKSLSRKPRRAARLAGVIALVAAAGMLAGAVHATPGDLDPTFGNGGLVTTAFPGWDASVGEVTIQADGKIIAVGYVREGLDFPPPMSFVVARYNPDGTLDPSFGVGGTAITKVGSSSAASAAVVQPDGKIVAAGSTWPGAFALARFNPDGTLDLSFGTGGKVITDIGQPNSGITALAIQPDGKIVVGGGNGDAGDAAKNFVAARYQANGGLDTTFGIGGIAFTNFGRGGMVRGLSIQPDGKIVEAGSAEVLSYPFLVFALVRFNSNGSLDNTFGTGGKVTTSFPGGGGAMDVVVQGDGKLVAVGGASTNAAVGGFGLARYNTDGSLDTSFGSAGMVLTLFGGSASASSVALRGDGRIVAAGHWVTPSWSGDFALAQYGEDGSLDTSFGTGGKVTTDFAGGSEGAHAVAIQPDGMIVAAGGRFLYPETNTFALARYLASDTTPPVITVPVDMTVDATSPAGTVVGFTATATDENPLNPTVTCAPASGSVFPIGDTTVACDATDTAGNTASASFEITVRGAPAQLADLGQAVEGVGPGAGLVDKVSAAKAALASNDVLETCSVLKAFINHVDAQSGNSILPATATSLITSATRIRAVLGC